MDKEEKFKSKFFYGVGIGKNSNSLRSDDADIKNFFEKIFFFWLTRRSLLRRSHLLLVASLCEEKEKSSAKKEKDKPGPACEQSRARNKS